MKPKFRSALPSVSIHLVFCLVALPAIAADYDWDNGSGDGLWNTATNWNPDVLPTTGDNVFVTVDGAVTKTITLPATPSNATILEVGLARTGNGTATVNHTGGTLEVTSWFNLGQGGGVAPSDGTGVWNMSGNAVLNATHASGGLTTIGAGSTATNYNKGILNISGNAQFNHGANSLRIGGEGSGNRGHGIVNISDSGKLIDSSPFSINNGVLVGYAGNGSVGALNLSGNAELVTPFLFIGVSPDSYGATKVSGGSVTVWGDLNLASWGEGYQSNGGSGLLEISSGTVNVNGWLTMSRWGASQTAVLHVSGGGLTYGGGGLVGNWNGDGGDTSIISVSGGGSISTANDSAINLSWDGNAANNGYLNLNGGTVTPARVVGSRGFINFNGGTLRANSDQGDFLAVNTTQIFSGGAIIDTNTRNITINQALVAPADEGVTTIPVTDGGSGYVAAPILTISGGTGSGATAVANMIPDGSGALKIGSVTVTSRGNYTLAPTTVNQIGGGPTIPATFGTLTTTANTSGGLTKIGAGTLTLAGTNTYSGPTQVNAGRLNVSGSLASNITVANGANLGGAGLTTGSLVFSPGTQNFLINTATSSSFLADSITAAGATVVVVPEGGLTPISDKVILETTSVPISGIISNFVSANPRLILAFDVTGYQLLASYAPASLVWTGSHGTNPTFWDNQTTANWAAPAAEVFVVNDSVTFNDTATAASPVQVAIQAAVQPASVVFENSTKDYVLSGQPITGATGLTVNAGGKVTLSNSNSYSGATLVSSGTLELSGTNNGSPLQVNGTGALVKITGGSTTVPSVWNNTHVIGGSTLEIDGGSLLIQGGGAWLSVGHHSTLPTGTGTITLNSGSFTNNNSWGIVVGGSSDGTGTINVNGGVFTADNGNNSGIILGEQGGGNGIVNLNGGLLIADQIYAGAGTGSINCNGGKLQSTGQVGALIPASANLTTTLLSGGLKVGGTPDFSIDAPLGGVGGLTKEDGNTVTLTALNSYSGNTSVTGGVLAISQPYLANGSSVSIAASAKMALNFTGDDTVTSVTLGGTTYTAPGSYNATTFPAFFTGTGSLVIPSSGTPYDSWLTAYPSITGANRAPDADPDSDGVSNGIEFMLGTSPANGASRSVPSITRNGSGNLVVSFTRVDAAEAFPVVVESSTNLLPPWTEVTVPNDAIAGPPITVADNGTNPDSITVIVPGAPDPKKFARVKITIPFVP